MREPRTRLCPWWRFFSLRWAKWPSLRPCHVSTLGLKKALKVPNRSTLYIPSLPASISEHSSLCSAFQGRGSWPRVGGLTGPTCRWNRRTRDACEWAGWWIERRKKGWRHILKHLGRSRDEMGTILKGDYCTCVRCCFLSCRKCGGDT